MTSVCTQLRSFSILNPFYYYFFLWMVHKRQRRPLNFLVKWKVLYPSESFFKLTTTNDERSTIYSILSVFPLLFNNCLFLFFLIQFTCMYKYIITFVCTFVVKSCLIVFLYFNILYEFTTHKKVRRPVIVCMYRVSKKYNFLPFFSSFHTLHLSPLYTYNKTQQQHYFILRLIVSYSFIHLTL